MLRIKKFLYKKPSFIYHLGEMTFKVFTPNGMPFKLAEVEGNKSAVKAGFWKGQVLEVKSGLFYLKMKRGLPVSMKSWAEAENLIEAKLQQALTYPRGAVHQAYDFAYLRRLESQGLDMGLLGRAEDVLKTVSLPITSAHGDLHIENMVFIGRDLKIIDWSMFTSSGSFVTDYIHFYNCRNAKTRKESWTQSILKKQEYLTDLATRFDTDANTLRLVYSISRIAGEIKQRESLSLVSKQEIAKYSFVLNHILNESKEALVQRSNSSV